MDTRQTLLYCLHCLKLTFHWRRWFPLIGTHYVCEVCEAREREEYARMAQEEIDEKTA